MVRSMEEGSGRNLQHLIRINMMAITLMIRNMELENSDGKAAMYIKVHTKTMREMDLV